jgi:hypothetical protein
MKANQNITFNVSADGIELEYETMTLEDIFLNGYSKMSLKEFNKLDTDKQNSVLTEIAESLFDTTVLEYGWELEEDDW